MLNGSDNFFSTYSISPTYELYEDGSPDGIPDMREALAGSINNQGGLTNGGEVVILYHWDGASDLVTDLDYVVWVDKNEAVDKTGVLSWTSRAGKPNEWNSEKWLTVTEAMALDEPDNSWMSDPWKRSKFYGWTEYNNDGKVGE